MIYLCFDAALNEEYTLVKLLQKYPNYISLFTGTDDASIWDVAPYLFEIEDDFYALKSDPFIKLDRCIIFETKEPKEEVCRFLQYYVYRVNSNTYLRIWDAAVLLKKLPGWDVTEKQKFFEFFKCFYTESAEQGYLDKWEAGRFYKPVSEKIEKDKVLKVFSQVSKEQEVSKGEPLVVDQNITQNEREMPQEPIESKAVKKRRFFIE